MVNKKQDMTSDYKNWVHSRLIIGNQKIFLISKFKKYRRKHKSTDYMLKLLHNNKKFKANKLGIYLQQIKTIISSWLDF